MKTHYLITTLISYEPIPKGEIVPNNNTVTDIYVFVYVNEDDEMAFTKSTLLKLELMAVKSYCTAHKIDYEKDIKTSSSQLLAISNLGKFDSFDDCSEVTH